MNESKVEVIFGHDCNVSTAYTTHADYRALEEQRDSFKSLWEQAEASLVTTLEELASIKVRVGEGK